MMASICEKVDLFVDGDLSPEEAEEFRLHLPDCAACDHALTELMLLKAMGRRHLRNAAASAPVPTVRPVHRAHWSRRPAFLAAASAAAILAIVAVVVRDPPLHEVEVPEDAYLANNSERWNEARVSTPAADEYRPQASVPMGDAQAPEGLPLEALAALNSRGDRLGLAAVYLVRNDPGLADQALHELSKLERSPDRDNDRAVAMLLKGEPAKALELADSALEQDPHHPQALWNRGLALRALGLPLLAAKAFSEVASLQEQGWATEALQKLEKLQRDATMRREQWEAASRAGEALLDAAPGSLPVDFLQNPGSRRFFYDAVRAAPSRERVLALLPVAQGLDARTRGNVLERHVRRIAESDFRRRAPLARGYVALLRNQLTAPEKEQFLQQVLKSKEDDIVMGTLAVLGPTARYIETFEAKAAASGDPWFPLLAAQARTKVDISAGRWTRAIQTLLEAQRRCPERGLEYRCISIDLDLSSLYIKLEQTDAARTHTVHGWKEAIASSEWGMESRHLWNLSAIARYANNPSLARAYLGEYLERDRNNPDTQRRVHQELAIIALQDLRADEARREMDAALATGVPLSLTGALALADISRLRGEPEDEARLTQVLEKARPSWSPGERAQATHALGRLVIEKDPERGRSLLWRSIQEAEAVGRGEDQAARLARAYSFTSLLLEAGRRQGFTDALKLLEQERGQELPRRCLLAATVDSERTLLLALGGSGELTGHYDQTRRQRLSQRLDGLVPERLLAALRGCEQVEVLARPPLHGRAGLLPPDMAWSYLTHTTAPRKPPQAGSALHLVVSVSDVELPKELGLKRLNTWSPSIGQGEQPVMLSGASATPSRVLAAMRTATEIDLVAHGIINADADASYLLLAPESDGQELGALEVSAAPLEGAPFVVLAACHAAHTTYSLDVPFSLPAAFIQAGARGVLAATEEIPDLEAGRFFNAIREHIRSGLPPALALRQERMQWIQAGRGAPWIESVLLFE
jgi:Tfp pilus assembly protein PilF